MIENNFNFKNKYTSFLNLMQNIYKIQGIDAEGVICALAESEEVATKIKEHYEKDGYKCTLSLGCTHVQTSTFEKTITKQKYKQLNEKMLTVVYNKSDHSVWLDRFSEEEINELIKDLEQGDRLVFWNEIKGKGEYIVPLF